MRIFLRKRIFRKDKEITVNKGESGEMYLETILVLSHKKSDVHAVDVAEEMGYSKPSVSRGTGLLKKAGLIEVDKDGVIKLTAEGLKKAEAIYDRHRTITKALVKMGASPVSAEDNACRIEHVVSPDVFEAIKKFANE